jgi:hypothetical protein
VQVSGEAISSKVFVFYSRDCFVPRSDGQEVCAHTKKKRLVERLAKHPLRCYGTFSRAIAGCVL